MTLSLPIKPGKTYRTYGGAVVRTGPLSAAKTLPLYTSDVTGLPPGLSVNSDNGRVSGLRHDVSDFHLREGPLASESSVGHPHAASMAEYAKDAAEAARPWERWELRAKDGQWESSLTENPAWNITTEYRRKPKTREIHATLPEPLRVTPTPGTLVYLAAFWDTQVMEFYWSPINSSAPRWLNLGLVYATEAEAQAAFHALATALKP